MISFISGGKMPSRKIEDLIPEMQVLARQFEIKMAEANIPFIFTCTYRSQENQEILWNQGRTTPGKIVTWTHNSRHTKRDAFDIAILKDKKPVWDIKVDVDNDSIPDYIEAGKIGESLGLEWGGSWKKKDYPHFQGNFLKGE
jgi:peptidoglycan L-alanyl-D-glutamate endopeptidase CwlK